MKDIEYWVILVMSILHFLSVWHDIVRLP